MSFKYGSTEQAVVLLLILLILLLLLLLTSWAWLCSEWCWRFFMVPCSWTLLIGGTNELEISGVLPRAYGIVSGTLWYSLFVSSLNMSYNFLGASSEPNVEQKKRKKRKIQGCEYNFIQKKTENWKPYLDPLRAARTIEIYRWHGSCPPEPMGWRGPTSLGTRCVDVRRGGSTHSRNAFVICSERRSSVLPIDSTTRGGSCNNKKQPQESIRQCSPARKVL